MTFFRTRFVKIGICSNKMVTRCPPVNCGVFQLMKKEVFDEFWRSTICNKGTF